MAIDTRAKRQSAHRVANPYARTLPLADGTVAQADRQHFAGYYGGILAAALAVPIIAKYAAEHARAYAMVKRAAERDFSDLHARALSKVDDAGAS